MHELPEEIPDPDHGFQNQGTIEKTQDDDNMEGIKTNRESFQTSDIKKIEHISKITEKKINNVDL